MITENAATAIAQGKEYILDGKELVERATELLLEAGRCFAIGKEMLKRQFGAAVEEASLAKAQVSKLIKAADIADNLPTKLAPQIGLHMLLQLGQARNEEAIAHLNPNDTQLSVAEKIKEYRKPPKPKMPKPVMQWEKNREGDRTLVIRLSDSDIALDLESGYKKAAMPLPLYFSALLEGNGGAWQQAQQELEEYMESQSKEVVAAPGLEIGDRVKVAGQMGTIVGFEQKPYTDETHPVIAWGSGGNSALSPSNIEVVEKGSRVAVVEKSPCFVIGQRVLFRGESYTVVSEPNEDGDILVTRANGTTRHLKQDVLARAT